MVDLLHEWDNPNQEPNDWLEEDLIGFAARVGQAFQQLGRTHVESEAERLNTICEDGSS